MQIITSTEVSEERICDLFINFIEGMVSSWCRSLQWNNPDKGMFENDNRATWYMFPANYDEDFKVKIVADAIDGDEDTITKFVDRNDLIKAMTDMATNSRKDFDDMMSENDDYTTADILLQYLTYGEVIFG